MLIQNSKIIQKYNKSKVQQIRKTTDVMTLRNSPIMNGSKIGQNDVTN